jgi:hypothetical protein
MTWEARGKPPAYRYLFPIPPDGAARSDVRVVPLSFDLSAPLVIEGESLWPALRQEGGHGLATYASGTCASSERWLSLVPADSAAPASVTLSLPAPFLAGRSISPRLGLAGSVSGRVVLSIQTPGAPRFDHTWSFSGSSPPPRCESLPPFMIPADARVLTLTITRAPGPLTGRVALDRVELVEGEIH